MLVSQLLGKLGQISMGYMKNMSDMKKYLCMYGHQCYGSHHLTNSILQCGKHNKLINSWC